jgi:hypothetical protein
MPYDKFTYDLGSLRLTKTDKAELEKEFEGVGEYLVCSDELADEQAKAEILSTLWAFKPSFLAEMTKLDSVVFEKLATLCEDSNTAIQTIIKVTCGLDYLVEQAITSDGRGHFLASFDGEEIEYHTKSGKTVYLYRCN